MNIPAFPNFRPIMLGDNSWYSEYYAHFDPVASHYFGNLLSWAGLYDNLAISSLNDNIVFQYNDALNATKKSLSYSLLGKTKPAETLQSFFTDLPDPDVALSVVPESFVGELGASPYTVAEDRNSAEYILDIEAFATLHGAQYLPLKSAFENFLKSYQDKVELKAYDISDAASQQYLLNFYKQWAQQAQLGNSAEELETLAIQKRFQLSKVVKLQCLAVHINGNIEGFLFYSYPPQHSYVLVHHIKCNYHLYDYMLFLAANIFHKEKKKYMNIEQDYGNEVLRQHREGLRPMQMFKKYSIARS